MTSYLPPLFSNLGYGPDIEIYIKICNEIYEYFNSLCLFFRRFISAVDYFGSRYPDRDVEFKIAAFYVYSTVFMTLVNSFFVGRISPFVRVRVGYLLFLPPLIIVPVLDPFLHNGSVSPDTGFVITLICMVLTGLGCGCKSLVFPFLTFFISRIVNALLVPVLVQQGSFYGLTGMFPVEHTQAIMAGEGFVDPGISSCCPIR